MSTTITDWSADVFREIGPWQGETYEEISTELDMPVNTIGSVLTRARAKLRELSKSYAAIPAYQPKKAKSSAKSKKPKPKPTEPPKA